MPAKKKKVLRTYVDVVMPRATGGADRKTFTDRAKAIAHFRKLSHQTDKELRPYTIVYQKEA